jgi:lysophospholipase L1-like esterase
VAAIVLLGAVDPAIDGVIRRTADANHVAYVALGRPDGGDGIHFSRAGYHRLAERVRAAALLSSTSTSAR